MKNAVLKFYRDRNPGNENIDDVMNDVTLTFVNGFRDTRIIIGDAIESEIKNDGERTLIELIAFHGYSYRAVAKMMGYTKKTVEYRYDAIAKRILDNLRDRGIKNIEGALKRLEQDFKVEELRQYKASHIFEDIAAESKEIFLTYKVKSKDFDNAGQASTQMKRNLKQLGIRPDIIHRLAIVSYEAEMNVVLHSDGGIMEYRITPEEITLKVEDFGPGIEDIEKAMRPGYSTATDWIRELGFGAGMGLPNIKKYSDRMWIGSRPGAGTAIIIHILMNAGNNDSLHSINKLPLFLQKVCIR